MRSRAAHGMISPLLEFCLRQLTLETLNPATAPGFYCLKLAVIAPAVERSPCKRMVRGSNPRDGTKAWRLKRLRLIWGEILAKARNNLSKLGEEPGANF